MKFTTEKKICILTQSHLVNNPRVLKEAITLAQHGFRVSILNAVHRSDLMIQDLDCIKGHAISLIPVADLSNKNLRSLCDRLLYRLGRFSVKYLKWNSSLALGYGSLRYLARSIATKADLYICHQELACYTGTRLIKKGYRVAFDFEDWYSEDLLPIARASRPIKLLKSVEGIALQKGCHCVTTSKALAIALASTYKSPLPMVIYNVFPSTGDALKKSKDYTGPLKLFWFSQTIGPGRGLENFIDLLPALRRQTELHLLGEITMEYRHHLNELLPPGYQVYFHSPVAAADLPEKIAGFDIGLALESSTPLSRNLTITNKFFQYLQSGLPVIATETEGQREAFAPKRPGFMMSQVPTAVEIQALNDWLENPDALREARERVIQATAEYNWENEAKKIIDLTLKAIENKRQPPD